MQLRLSLHAIRGHTFLHNQNGLCPCKALSSGLFILIVVTTLTTKPTFGEHYKQCVRTLMRLPSRQKREEHWPVALAHGPRPLALGPSPLARGLWCFDLGPWPLVLPKIVNNLTTNATFGHYLPTQMCILSKAVTKLTIKSPCGQLCQHKCTSYQKLSTTWPPIQHLAHICQHKCVFHGKLSTIWQTIQHFGEHLLTQMYILSEVFNSLTKPSDILQTLVNTNAHSIKSRHPNIWPTPQHLATMCQHKCAFHQKLSPICQTKHHLVNIC